MLASYIKLNLIITQANKKRRSYEENQIIWILMYVPLRWKTVKCEFRGEIFKGTEKKLVTFIRSI